MKKVTTTIFRNGKEQIVSLFLDSTTADILNYCEDKEFVRNYMLQEYEAYLIERKETRYSQSMEASIENGFEFEDKNSNIEDNFFMPVENEKLHKAIEMLKPQQKWLIEQIYYLDRNQVDIALELGINKSNVCRQLETILKKLKKLL